MSLESCEKLDDFENYASSDLNNRKNLEETNVKNGIFYDSDSDDKRES